MIVEILLGVCGFSMDKGAELALVNADIDVQKGDVGVEVFQVKWTG